VIYAEGGLDLHDHDSGWGEARALDYLRQRYHRPGDEYDPAWDLSGAMQDLALYRDVALALANDTAFPRWRAGSEFRARRETDRPIEGGRAAER
jgi:hypothetical protein